MNSDNAIKIEFSNNTFKMFINKLIIWNNKMSNNTTNTIAIDYFYNNICMDANYLEDAKNELFTMFYNKKINNKELGYKFVHYFSIPYEMCGKIKKCMNALLKIRAKDGPFKKYNHGIKNDFMKKTIDNFCEMFDFDDCENIDDRCEKYKKNFTLYKTINIRNAVTHSRWHIQFCNRGNDELEYTITTSNTTGCDISQNGYITEDIKLIYNYFLDIKNKFDKIVEIIEIYKRAEQTKSVYCCCVGKNNNNEYNLYKCEIDKNITNIDIDNNTITYTYSNIRHAREWLNTNTLNKNLFILLNDISIEKLTKHKFIKNIQEISKEHSFEYGKNVDSLTYDGSEHHNLCEELNHDLKNEDMEYFFGLGNIDKNDPYFNEYNKLLITKYDFTDMDNGSIMKIVNNAKILHRKNILSIDEYSDFLMKIYFRYNSIKYLNQNSKEEILQCIENIIHTHQKYSAELFSISNIKDILKEYLENNTESLESYIKIMQQIMNQNFYIFCVEVLNYTNIDIPKTKTKLLYEIINAQEPDCFDKIKSVDFENIVNLLDYELESIEKIFKNCVDKLKLIKYIDACNNDNLCDFVDAYTKHISKINLTANEYTSIHKIKKANKLYQYLQTLNSAQNNNP